MKTSKKIVKKYQEQLNETSFIKSKINIDSNGGLNKFEKFSESIKADSFYNKNLNSDLFFKTNQIEDKKLVMATSIFSLPNENSDNCLNAHQENLLRITSLNYRGSPYKDLHEVMQLRSKLDSATGWNLVKNDFSTNQIPLYGENYVNDLNEDHSPLNEFSDEQMSEDEQPLDFSIKSKNKEFYNVKEKNNFNNQLYLVNDSINSIDQIDGSWKVSNHAVKQNNLLNCAQHQQLNSKFQNLSNTANYGNPYINSLFLTESQTNIIHSEPSSPEGLSSASSTSSSQGYYSSSSLNSSNFKLQLNQNVAPALFSNSYQQSMNKSHNKNYMQIAPPSYASLNFDNKQNFSKNNNQQTRPSVIVSNSKSRQLNSVNAFNKESKNNLNENTSIKCFYNTPSNKIGDSIDEHFRLSLGNSYNKIINNQHTLKDEAKINFSPKVEQSTSIIDEHFKRALNSKKATTIIESSTSVDDHFAKALGDTWFKLKKDNSSS